MAQHNILGKLGEDQAVDFLTKKGYQILDRNWKIGDLELDIVAQEADTLVFVEVKTRATDAWGNPEDAVDELRKNRMSRAANAYIKFKRLDIPYRFDIIAIVVNDNQLQIKHIEDAFTIRPRFISLGSMRPENKWNKSYWKKR